MKKFLVFIFVFSGLFLSARVQAQVFIAFDRVDGESLKAGHDKEMEILSFSLGSTLPVTLSTAGGAGVGKVKFEDIAFTKMRGPSSATLQTKQFRGETITSATINFFKPAEKSAYMKITLTGVRITSIALSGSGTEPMTEAITLSYMTIKIEETYMGPGGVPKKSLTKWNLAENSDRVM